MPYDARPWRQRFFASIPTPITSGCWDWQGDRNTYGYGRITVNGKRDGAHRVSYRMHHGPIPRGMQVCHSCDNPPCVNPGHLFLGTAKDNARDRQEKGRHTPPRFTRDNHPRAKISVRQAGEIAAEAVLGRGGNVAEIARRHGVSRQVIYSIIKEYT